MKTQDEIRKEIEALKIQLKSHEESHKRSVELRMPDFVVQGDLDNIKQTRVKIAVLEWVIR